MKLLLLGCLDYFSFQRIQSEDLNKFQALEQLGVDVLCTNRPDIAIMDYKK